MSDIMHIDCEEWREVAAEFPAEMEVIVEMMIEADEELCYDEAA
ncbi:MAG: hypothetical protein ABFR19_08405 [Pseudomonadota bacterium]